MRSNAPRDERDPPEGRTAAVVATLVVLAAAAVATGLALRGGLSLPVIVLGWSSLLAIVLVEMVVRSHLQIRGTRATESPVDLETVRAEVAELSATLGVRRPPVVAVDRTEPWMAATTVPGFAGLRVSTGLLEATDPAERRALLAHEVAHVARRDGLVDLFVCVVANAIAIAVPWWWALRHASPEIQLAGVVGFQLLYLARSWFPAAILVGALSAFTPWVVNVAQATLARYQEYRADATAATLVGDPRHVVRGLGALDVRQRTIHPIGRIRWERDDGLLARLGAFHPPYFRRIDRLLDSVEPR